MSEKYTLHFYIAGMSPETQTLIVDIKDFLTTKLGENKYNLKVVDVLEKPELAQEEHILATPTMVRHIPEPLKKIILNPNPENTMKTLKVIFEDE